MNGSKRTSAARLDPERVVRTALALLDGEGLDGLTLRRIGKELDVQAPALYWHFRSKQALLEEMAATMLRDLRSQGAFAPAELPWDEWMLQSMQRLRRMLLRYRDGARVFSGTYLADDTLLEGLEAPLRVMTNAGFSIAEAARAWSTLYSYTIGFVIEEQAVKPRPGERDERYAQKNRARRIDSDKFPLSIAAGKTLFSRFDQGYDEGLRLILAGIAQGLDR